MVSDHKGLFYLRRQILYSILNFMGSQCSEANTGKNRSLLYVGSFKCSSSQDTSCNIPGQLENLKRFIGLARKRGIPETQPKRNKCIALHLLLNQDVPVLEEALVSVFLFLLLVNFPSVTVLQSILALPVIFIPSATCGHSSISSAMPQNLMPCFDIAT